MFYKCFINIQPKNKTIIMNQTNTNQTNTNQNNIERMNREIEMRKISYFIRGVNTSTTIIVVVYVTIIIIISAVSPNYTADDVRNKLFESLDFETYKNIDEYKECYPKNGCIDTGICYSSNTNNICDFQLHKTCECANMNCTIDDWNTVNIKSCHMISGSDIIGLILLTILIVSAVLAYFILIDCMLYNITTKRIIHFRYFIMVCLLQIFNMWMFVTIHENMSKNNFKGIYWVGAVKLWVIWFFQNLVLIWPRIMDKTTRPNQTKYYPRIVQLVEPIQPINHPTQNNIVIEQVGEETNFNELTEPDSEQQPQETTFVQLVENRVQTINPIDLIQVIHNSSSIHEDTVSNHQETRQSIVEGTPQRETTADNLCLICCSHKREILLFPCCHICYCRECGNSRTINICPYCRTNITHTLKVFIP